MTKHLRFLFVMLLAMIWSAGWAAETVYKTLSFPDNNQANNKVSGYTSSWTAKIGSDSWSIVNFNNNNWNNYWTYIKCGNKNKASVATITNSNTFDNAIIKVVVKAPSITVTSVNSITLEVSTNKSFDKTKTETITLPNIKQGDLTFDITKPIANGYYRLSFDCKKAKAIVRVDQVDYYVNDSKTSTTLEFPQDAFTFATTDNYSSFTGQAATLIADGAELTGKTIAYSKSGDDIFSSFNESDGTLALNGNLGTATVTANFDGSNDETYASSSASYTITVNKLYSTIASFKKDIPSTAIDKALPFCLKLTDAIVTYVNGKKAYLQDATSGVLIYGDNALDLKAGEKYTGIVNVSACLFNGMAEITAWNAASDIVKEENVDIPVVSVTLEQLNGNDYSKYECVRVKVENATVSTGYTSAKKATIVQGEQKYLIHGEINGLKVTKDDLCDFVGYPIYWKTTSLDEHQLSVWSQDDIIVKPVVLDESATNTIEAKTDVNVTLNRPMNVGRWNTFCVPFSIDANQVTSQFGEGTQIAEYSVSVDNEIDFATVQSNAIVAGKAYLVKPTKVAATEGYTFSNVNITALEPTKETVDNGAIDFRGIYNPTDITVGLPTNTFAAGIVGNVVKNAVNGSNMKGFRAFFIIPEGAGAQSSYMLKIDGTATSINSINGADVVVNAPVYNLQGQRVDGNNLTPGIYVKAGKKFVVK